MIRRLILLAWLGGAAFPVSSGDDPFSAADAVSDSELATMRGGFTLPNGIDVALSVRIDTLVDGALVLRTVFEADTGPARLAVFAPAPGTSVPGSSGTIQVGSTGPVLILDRAGGTMSLQPGSQAITAGTVTIGNMAKAEASMEPSGLSPLAISVGGPGVQTAAGIVSLYEQPVGRRVVLDGPGLDVVHFVGQAFGTVIANRVDNRAIDTVATINLQLGGAEDFAASTAALKGQDVALDAVSRLRF